MIFDFFRKQNVFWKRPKKKIGKRKSRKEIMKNREKTENIGQTRKMTTQGGKHTRKNQITVGFQKKNIFVFKKIDHRKFSFFFFEKNVKKK